MITGKFRHHMIREIYEAPRVVQATLGEGSKEVQEISSKILSEHYEIIYITGSGTSYHAGLAGQYALSTLTGLVTSLIPASELPLWIPPIIPRKTLLIAISQSGESSDVLAAAKAALNRKMDVLAVTNTQGSSLMKMSQYTLLTRADEEHAVTATKTYIAQLVAIFLLSLELASGQPFWAKDLAQLRRKLFNAPNLIMKTINLTESLMRKLANVHSDKNLFFLLGSGPNYATALEGALKLKEACNIFAEGFASREFLHGPIQLVDERTPVLFIVPADEIDNLLGLMESLRKLGVPVISISEKKAKLRDVMTDIICVSEDLPKLFSPVL